jgi:hypothetical protein
MSTEASNLALKNTLNEVRNVCPDISSTFIFRENGEIIAQDQDTSEEMICESCAAFNELSEKAAALGGLESVTIRGADARVNFSKLNGFYIANVASNGADERTIGSITKIMIPTMLKLVEQAAPVVEEPQKILEPKTEFVTQTAIPEPVAPEIQETRLFVENLGFGKFLGDPNIVLVDRALIAQWKEIFGHRKISKVSLQNPTTSKCMQFVFKPIKEGKFDGKSVIQLSDKIQDALSVHKGSQILVNPVIEIQTETPEPALDEPSSREDVETPPPPEEPAEKDQEDEFSVEAVESDAPMSQFIVANQPEYVRIDKATIAQWKEKFEGKEITKVIIEDTVTGKKIRSPFQPLKNENLEGKGIIQLPEKAQALLETKKGSLVVVKPVVE